MAKPPTKKTAATRGRIMGTAVDLFNERGPRAVTTHDIADAVGMSPGNLYYHFKNKEEIIREVFSTIELFSPERWSQAISQNEPESFYAFLEFFFSQLHKFRFFFREQAELTRSDDVLAAMWKESHGNLTTVMRKAASHWVELGILMPFESPHDVDAFIDNSWIIASFSYSYFEGKGETKPKRLEAAVSRQLSSFLRAFHTVEGRKLLDQFFAQA